MAKCFGSNDKNVWRAPVVQYDPFGAETGGRQERSYIFNQLDQARPQLEANRQNTEAALQNASRNPGYTAAADLATRTINGDFLHGSPEFNNQVAQMRTAGGREAADSAASAQDAATRSGMQFGTANQQAQQSNQAFNTAKANEAEAGMRAQNYAGERAAQMQAPGMLDAAVSAPINYLSQMSSAETAPLAQIAQIVAGLAGGGQVQATPQDITDKLGWADQGMQAVGRL